MMKNGIETNQTKEATMAQRTFSVGNTFEAHVSASYKNAIKFAIAMAKSQPSEPVRISWDMHGIAFGETFVWSDDLNDIIPHYGG